MNRLDAPLTQGDAAAVVRDMGRGIGLGAVHIERLARGLGEERAEPHSAIANVIRSHMAGAEQQPDPGRVAQALHCGARTETQRRMLRPVLRQMDKYGGPPVESFLCCIQEGLPAENAAGRDARRRGTQPALRGRDATTTTDGGRGHARGAARRRAPERIGGARGGDAGAPHRDVQDARPGAVRPRHGGEAAGDGAQRRRARRDPRDRLGRGEGRHPCGRPGAPGEGGTPAQPRGRVRAGRRPEVRNPGTPGTRPRRRPGPGT